MAPIRKRPPPAVKRAPKIPSQPEHGEAIELRNFSRPAPAVNLTRGAIPVGLKVMDFSGTYKVGHHTGDDYPDLQTMATVLNSVTLTGSVEFDLTDAAYNEPGIAIGLTTRQDNQPYPIVIRPASGNTSCVINLTDNTTNGGGFVLNGAQSITIEGTASGSPDGERDLTIKLSADPVSPHGTDAPLRIFNGKNITVTDCSIMGNSPSASWADKHSGGNASVYITATAGNLDSNITVNNCDLSLGHLGVESAGNYVADAAHYSVQDDHLSVTNNYIHDVTETGIRLDQVSNATVKDNQIHRVVLGAGAGTTPTLLKNGILANLPQQWRAAGIQVWGDNAAINYNTVDSVVCNRITSSYAGGAYGIRAIGFGNNDPDVQFGGTFSLMAAPSKNVVINNIITRIYSRGIQNYLPGHEFGIEIESGALDTVYYNTIYFSGTELPDNPGGAIPLLISGAYSTKDGYPLWVDSCINHSDGEQIRCVDNIFAIDRSGTVGSVCLGITGPGADYYADNDYNVLFNSTNGDIAQMGDGNIYSSIADLYWPTDGCEGHSQVDDPTLMNSSDVHINPAGYSTADGTGAYLEGIVPDDHDHAARPDPPNIGALEGRGAGPVHDVKPIALMYLDTACLSQNVAVQQFREEIRNLTPFEESVPVKIHIIAPDQSTTDFSETCPYIYGNDVQVWWVDGPWTPTLQGLYTIQVITELPDDRYPGNDTLTVHAHVVGTYQIPYCTGFETADDQAAWYGTNDWAIGDNATNTKFGGAHGGMKCFVTKPGTAGHNNYSDKTVSYVYSPFFDLSTWGQVSVSFWQAMLTEPSWDRSILEYTVDGGNTWQQVGTADSLGLPGSTLVNDPNGVNWYSSPPYANAGAACFDTANARQLGWPAWNPGVWPPPASWSSDGICTGADLATGPNGWVHVSFILNALTPSPFGNIIRFRYSTFADAYTDSDGWALDDFCIAPTLPGNQCGIIGIVFADNNGNGVPDPGEPGAAGKRVMLAYYGHVIAQTTTDNLGGYQFNVSLPGRYTPYIDSSQLPNTIFTGFSARNYLAYSGTCGTPMTANLGFFQGSISGLVFSDRNDNGLLDNGETGLAGYRINIRTGPNPTDPLVDSAITGADGNWIVLRLPGTYYATQDVPPTPGRLTAAPQTAITVQEPGGSPTAVITGENFGNFVFADMRCEALIDFYGDAVRHSNYYLGLPAGLTAHMALTRNNAPYFDTVLTNWVSDVECYVDTGTYTLTLADWSVDGWWRTNGNTFTCRVDTSGARDTMSFLFYQGARIGGRVFNDLNRNGSYNNKEPFLSGWIVHVSGNGAQNDTTDINGYFNGIGLGPGPHTIGVVGAVGDTDWLHSTPDLKNYSMISGGFYGHSFGVYKYSLQTNAGWNMVSVPLNTTHLNRSSVFTDATSYAFAYEGSYVQRDPLQLSKGYWLKFPGVKTEYMNGGNVSSDTVRLVPRWNMIGSITSGVPVSSIQQVDPGIVISPYWGYNYGYYTAVNITPGQAYWVKASGAGRLFLSSGHNTEPKNVAIDIPAGLDHLQIADAAGARQALYFGERKSPDMTVDRYELPPVPPEGAFDVRFASGGNVEFYDKNLQKPSKLLIQVQASNFPVTLHWTLGTQTGYYYCLNVSGNNGGKEKPIAGNGQIVITDKSVSAVTLTVSTTANIPDKFALAQNYPNPFNPSTSIEYQLPVDSKVTLKIYDILGQEVATLIDENQQAGYQEITWNPDRQASGIYYYRLDASPLSGTRAHFSQLHKMLFVK